MQCLEHAYIREDLGDTKRVFQSIKITYFGKWWPDRLLYATILDIIRIKIRHLKGENKWEIPGVYYTHDNHPA